MTCEAKQQADGIGIRGILLLLLGIVVSWFALFGAACLGVIYRAELAALWPAAASLIAGAKP